MYVITYFIKFVDNFLLLGYYRNTQAGVRVNDRLAGKSTHIPSVITLLNERINRI